MNDEDIIYILNLFELPLDQPITDEIISIQFRKLAKIYHPDVAQDIYKDGNKFKALQDGRSILKDNLTFINERISSSFNSTSAQPKENSELDSRKLEIRHSLMDKITELQKINITDKYYDYISKLLYGLLNSVYIFDSLSDLNSRYESILAEVKIALEKSHNETKESQQSEEARMLVTKKNSCYDKVFDELLNLNEQDYSKKNWIRLNELYKSFLVSIKIYNNIDVLKHDFTAFNFSKKKIKKLSDYKKLIISGSIAVASIILIIILIVSLN